jgi:excisionase family DNA binding protein
MFRPEDAAPIIGVGRTTLFALMRDGEIESVKVGRRRLIPAESLREFVARVRHDQKRRVVA